jgi:myosin-18
MSFQELLKKGPGEKQFLLQHFQGTNPVLYNAEGWLLASREDGAMKAAAFLLQESSQ